MRIITPILLVAIMSVSAQTRDYPKTPADKPKHVEGAQQASDLDRAIAPYVAKARKTYPSAKKRFLAGLPPKYLFSLTTKLWDHSHTKFEVVFVVADKISDGKVTGHLATHTKQPVGYNYGDRITFPESEVMDWTIVHPDGTEEGNVVGKFLDTYHG
jgi:Uncharacterized protein conserved in bacteria (DUF2314)